MQIQVVQQNCELLVKQIDIGKEEATKLYESEFWKGWSARDIADFQLYNKRLIVPWEVFHVAVEEVLGRDVYSHEFKYDSLRKEIDGEIPKKTLADVIDTFPKDKPITMAVV